MSLISRNCMYVCLFFPWCFRLDRTDVDLLCRPPLPLRQRPLDEGRQRKARRQACRGLWRQPFQGTRWVRLISHTPIIHLWVVSVIVGKHRWCIQCKDDRMFEVLNCLFCCLAILDLQISCTTPQKLGSVLSIRVSYMTVLKRILFRTNIRRNNSAEY